MLPRTGIRKGAAGTSSLKANQHWSCAGTVIAGCDKYRGTSETLQQRVLSMFWRIAALQAMHHKQLRHTAVHVCFLTHPLQCMHLAVPSGNVQQRTGHIMQQCRTTAAPAAAPLQADAQP